MGYIKGFVFIRGVWFHCGGDQALIYVQAGEFMLE